MKVHILYDAQGNIISVGAPLPLGYDFRGPIFGPQAQDGQFADELDVPEDQARLGLLHVAQNLQVDVSGTPHKLMAKP